MKHRKIHRLQLPLWILGLCMIPLLSHSQSQDEHESLMEGDKFYKGADYLKAEEEYLRATNANPKSVKGFFNRANAIFKGLNGEMDPEIKKKRLDKAAESYMSAIENTNNNQIKANAYHNLGNTYLEQKDFENSIEAYKNSLRLNPDDMDTKSNLQHALRQMEIEQQKQQQQQEQGGEGGEGEESEEQERQENEGDEEQDEDNNSAPNKPEKRKEDEEESEGGSQANDGEPDQPTPEEMTKEEVMRQLKVMDEEEKKVKEKLKKEQRSEYQSEKDW